MEDNNLLINKSGRHFALIPNESVTIYKLVAQIKYSKLNKANCSPK